MILTKEQARAVYDAMRALNNVSGNLRAVFAGCVVQERAATGQICITHYKGASEHHASQAMFHLAYDL